VRADQASVLLELTPMQLDQLDTVMRIERAAYPISWSRKVLEDCVASTNDCWVLRYDRQIVGHSILSNVLDETHLLNLCVEPSLSRNGFGRWMLRALIQKAMTRHSTIFFLEVRESNHRAIALYHSEGFNESGMRKNYYPAENGREHAILMSLDLSFDVYT